MKDGIAKLKSRKDIIHEEFRQKVWKSDPEIARIAGTSIDAVRVERLKLLHPELTNCVYFAQSIVESKSHGPIKVGWSDYLPYRLRKVQRQVPFEMKALAVIKGTKDDESKIHARFDYLRVKWGDWFYPDEEMSGYIENLVTEHNGMALILSTPKLFKTESGF